MIYYKKEPKYNYLKCVMYDPSKMNSLNREPHFFESKIIVYILIELFYRIKFKKNKNFVKKYQRVFNN